MSPQIWRSASRAAKSLLSSASRSSRFYSEGRAVASAVSFSGKLPFLASAHGRTGSSNVSRQWISGALAIPAAVYMLQEQEAHAAQMEQTFIAIKPDGVQRGLISEIVSRFERKGFKLVAIKVVVPSKEFAQKHYHDLKERPFFNGLCDFLSSGPVIAMVWEGEGVIKYGRKLIGATDPQKSEPGTIRGDLAVVVGRNIIHGSDGPETAKDEINLWFKPEDLVSYSSNAEKWIYGELIQSIHDPNIVRVNHRFLFRFSLLRRQSRLISCCKSMAIKSLTHEEIANTEKKLDMPLDDIIRMSKNTAKPKKQQRAPIKNQKLFNNPTHEKALKMRHYMDSRPLVRQAALAQRRSNFQRNQFPLTSEAARKAKVAPNRSWGRNFMANANNSRAGGVTVQRRAANGGFAIKSPSRPNHQQQQVDGGAKQRPQTLDSRFANMKEQRMKVLSRQNKVVQHNGGGRRPRVPWARVSLWTLSIQVGVCFSCRT
ncbi:NUCLEOSIDE DIPHOSPHATE KINASE [Salix viminalis]|uniref:Nucleoside diphosphate kinase n=1 Tax=Salix viminalis TaxID=40686 RepID=A0A9Q0T7K3_SALVM|nr:NUCLEOSIDE DIPHOSPHATE KINASE [Salix viminalis]